MIIMVAIEFVLRPARYLIGDKTQHLHRIFFVGQFFYRKLCQHRHFTSYIPLSIFRHQLFTHGGRYEVSYDCVFSHRNVLRDGIG